MRCEPSKSPLAIREIMLAALVERFGDRGVRVGTSLDPVAVFPAIHLDVGHVSVRIGGADHAIGSVVRALCRSPFVLPIGRFSRSGTWTKGAGISVLSA